MFYQPNDATNPDHQRLKNDIEEGNGLPDVGTVTECQMALLFAGFDVVTATDLAVSVAGPVQPWMTPLQLSWNVLSQRFQFNCVWALMVNAAIYTLETVRLAPAGTVKTQQILQAGGFALRDAGQAGIFTTMYLLVGRKPVCE